MRRPGTFWYHSHLAVQYCDGLRGVLVIKDPNDPFRHLYDVDNGTFIPRGQKSPSDCSTEDTVITLADWYHVIAETIVGPAYVILPVPVMTSHELLIARPHRL